MKLKKWIVPVLSAALCLFTGCRAPSGPELFEKTTFYFDTVVRISFYTDGDGEALMDHCMQMCDAFEKTFSRTDETSELYAVNHRSGSRVEVSEGIARLVSVGLAYYEKSGGKFDITVAPLSDLWDFKSEDAKAPKKEQIAEALAKVDASKVHVDGNTLVFDSPDTMLDLGALAKGYAADQIKAYLTGEGVTSGLINLGGNVLAIGSRPDGEKWRIGVQRPFAGRGETVTVLEVADQTVVSSGIYERYFEQDGHIYHHILDPENGYPTQGDLEEVTVICDSSLEGDALSTACLAVGSDAAWDLIRETQDAQAVFVFRGGEVRSTEQI